MLKGWSRAWSRGFDVAADAYDEARPGYPAGLYRDITRMCNLDAETRVLEAGCGTGQATKDIAPIVGNIVALEPGAALAARARTRLEKFPNVEIVKSTFEEYGGDGAFDLVFSATAFHWVEPEVGFAKAARMLRAGGWLALWWTSYFDPDGEDPFGEEVTAMFDARGHTSDDSGQPYALREDERIADFARVPEFGAVETKRYRWNGEHSAEEIRKLFSTYSNVQAMDETERLIVLDNVEEIATTKFGGHVTRPYLTLLYAARKTNGET